MKVNGKRKIADVYTNLFQENKRNPTVNNPKKEEYDETDRETDLTDTPLIRRIHPAFLFPWNRWPDVWARQFHLQVAQ